MNSYRDTYEYRLYEALRDKEQAEMVMDQWASEQLRKSAEKMEDLPE